MTRKKIFAIVGAMFSALTLGFNRATAAVPQATNLDTWRARLVDRIEAEAIRLRQEGIPVHCGNGQVCDYIRLSLAESDWQEFIAVAESGRDRGVTALYQNMLGKPVHNVEIFGYRIIRGLNRFGLVVLPSPLSPELWPKKLFV